MFSNQETHKILYEETLRKINAIGTRIQNDNDKIHLLGLINNLKYNKVIIYRTDRHGSIKISKNIYDFDSIKKKTPYEKAHKG